jgi:Tol biopolymer transport system component
MMNLLRFALAGACLTACFKSPVEGPLDPQACSALGDLNLGARIAISQLHGPIRLSTLNGDPERILITGNVNAQDWSPARDRLVYVDDRGNDEYALSVTDTFAVSQPLPVPLRSTWPVWSLDGWIYFFTQTDQPPEIRRIRPNGTGLSASLVVGRFPAPSPDGLRFAYFGSGKIWTFNLATSVSSPVTDANAIALRWSPDGSWIGYIENGQTTIVRPDGSEKRAIGPGSVGGISWSPDGCFVLAGSQTRSMLVIAQHGSFLDLPLTGLYPAWRP